MGHELLVLFLLHLVRLIFTVTIYSTPVVSYRETVSGTVSVDSKHPVTDPCQERLGHEAPGATIPVPIIQ